MNANASAAHRQRVHVRGGRKGRWSKDSERMVVKATKDGACEKLCGVRGCMWREKAKRAEKCDI